MSFTEEGTTSARMKLQFYDADDGTLAYVSPDSQDGKTFEARTLTINMHYFKNMSSSNRHGTAVISEEYGIKWQLDRTLVHELTHSVMASNVNYFHDFPLTIMEGATAELINGVDDKRYDNIIDCVKDESKFGELTRCLLPQVKGNGDMGSEFAYAGGYIFMRYFLKQAAETTFDYDTYHAKVSTDSLNFATNYFDTVTMSGSDAADTITNSGSKVSISALDGADLIKNYSAKVTISGGAGADSINNYGTKTSITAGAGNDSIYNDSAALNASIFGGSGKDTIVNLAGKSYLSGGSNNDEIFNSNTALNASIFGGKGNDTIINSAEKSYLAGDTGNDFISNVGKKANIQGGAGNDSVLNGQFPDDFGLLESSLATIMGMNSTIHGGDGNDSFYNYGESVFIYGDGGNDQIENSGAGSILYGGADNDSLENEGDVSKIYGDAGNDYIQNSGESSKLYGGAGNDSIKNTGDSSSLSGGAGNDSLVNRGDEVYIVGGSGDDSVYNSGAKITIGGGSGNDSLYNQGFEVYLSGGAGNDTIRNYGNHITISGGSGNDYLRNSGGRYITYNFGKSYGNDTVVGFNADDTIKITSGKYSATTSGNNVIVSVGSSSLTLKNAVGKAINFISSSGKTSTKTFSAVSNANVAELWFAAENDFAAEDLTSIVKNSPIATSYDKLDATRLENLASKDNLITYSGK